MQVPQVNANEAKKFSQVWNYKGVALLIDDAHCQFAADFANAVLRSFIEQMAAAERAAQQPKVLLAEN